MADLSITASAVRGSRKDTVNAGATLAAGQVVYKDDSNVAQLADANNVAAAIVSGIAMNAAVSGQPVSIHTSGPLTINAVLTAGTLYFLSNTAGGICPFADLATGSRVIIIGYATSTTVLNVHIVDTGVVL